MTRPLARDGQAYAALPARIVRAVVPDRLSALVDLDTRARIVGLLDELTVPVQTVCFECRLSADDARVDAAVCLFSGGRGPGDRERGLTDEDPRPGERGGEQQAEREGGSPDEVLGRLGARHGGDASWRRCLDFLAGWNSASSSFVGKIPFVCVAFDRPGGAPTLSVPALSLCVDRAFFARQLGVPAALCPRPPVPAICRLAATCYRRLHGHDLPEAAQALLRRCLSGGQGVVARHLSFMLSRTPATFKLDLRLALERVEPLLRRIAWPGDVPRIVAGIGRLMPWGGALQLNLVLHPALGSSLEVELLTGRGGDVATEDRLALLERLVSDGVCARSKADALADAWMNPVSRDGDGLVVARSWYLKARFEGHRLAEAKAYLGLMPRAWAGRRLTRPAGASSVTFSGSDQHHH